MSLPAHTRSFVEAYPLPAVIVQADHDFNLVYINEAFRDEPGFRKTSGDPTGQSLFSLFPGDSKRLCIALDQVLATKKSYTAEIQLPAPDGDGWQGQEIFTPVRDHSGEAAYIICSFLPARQQESEAWSQPKNVILNQLQERIKEQSCLYKISSLNEQELQISALLEKAVRILPAGWQHPDVAEAAIEYRGYTYATPGYRKTSRMLSSKTEIRSGIKLAVTVAYIEERPACDEGPFLIEERYLIDSVTSHLALKLERKLAQQELEEKQLLLDKAYHLAHIGTWEFDMQTHELQWSHITKEVHGVGPDHQPSVESTINLFKEGVNRQKFAEAARAAIEEEQAFDVELKIVTGQGEERWIRATGEPEYKDGVCTHFYGISQNVTDRRKAEEDLMHSEQRFRSLVQDGSDLIAILDAEANYLYVSPTCEPILGFPDEDLIGTNALDYIHPDERGRLTDIIDGVAPGRRVNIESFRFRNAEGQWRWLESTLTNMTHDPAVGGLIVNSRDVTDQIRQQQKILETLQEKETLLAEIHHRVKNNLAVVSGMMQLQINEEDHELNDKLHDSIIRIKTMANIHEQLYQSKSFSELEFADNIRSLVADIQRTLQVDTPVRIAFDCEPVQLNINQAIPCSLIVNEVVTNIFKHAFTDRDQGHVFIALSEPAAGKELLLSIKDDGIGLPANFEQHSTDSLGLTLIDVLSQQLGATFCYESADEGTAFILRFEKDNMKGIGNSLL